MINCYLPIRPLSQALFEQQLDQAIPLVTDQMGPKVLRLPNGRFIKLFRRKRWISSALYAPYAVRFVNNAKQLKSLNISTVTPTALQYYPNKKIHIVEYIPLDGIPLRTQLQQTQQAALPTLLLKTAAFIADLHRQGVYFRSLHFANIIVHPQGLGLIDIADMVIYNRSLNSWMRQRNFQHFMRYPQDSKIIKLFGLQKFIKHYEQKFYMNNS